jgi:DeoR/GlpR family transcriptional regulator of sugar metabolism
MLIAERQSRLLDVLSRQGMLDHESLSRELGVSASTVRRDLEQLEQRGLVRRTHGGAVWTGDEVKETARPYAFEQRMQFLVEAKQRIARAARSLIKPGETVLLDGGTTTYYFARELLGTPLQVVTNSLPIASMFQNDDHIELILTGGVVYPRYGVLLGPVAETMIASIHASTLFLSVAGLRGDELFNQNMLLVQAERKMMEQCQRVVLLIDGTKFGQQALVKLCGLDEVDVVVTDAPLPDEVESTARAARCDVVVASD